MNNIKIKQTLNKIKFGAMKNSPKILMVTGVVGIVGASVLACRSTLKINNIMEESKNITKEIEDAIADETIEYTEEDAKSDLVKVQAKMIVDIAKLYAPAVILGSASLLCIIQSNKILNRRNVALAAALTTTSETFARYRKEVVDRYGERIDHELRYGIKTDKVTVEDENGKKRKETIDIVDGKINEYSDYARFYDDGCEGWTKDAECNLMFLKAQQQYANDKLVANGYLFLNDVYDMLGIPKTKAGQIVGWMYDANNPSGDNFVDFGIYDVNKTNARDFVNGIEKTILLDFNVDGNIWDRM